MMYKRGLSDIVTTLLIILLAFASVAIIWVVVKAFIFESAGQLEIGQFTNRFSIPDESVMVNNQLGLVTFNVKREAGDGDIAELNVILKGSDGTSKNFPQDFRTTGFNVYESKRFEVSYLGSGISQLASISLSATIKNQAGKELKGSPILAYTVKGNEKLAGMVLWLDFENGLVDKSGWGNVVNPSGGITSGNDPSTSGTRGTKVAIFNGATSALEIAGSSSSSLFNFGTGSFTITFWARPDGRTGTGLANGWVLDKYTTSGYRVPFFDSSGIFMLNPSLVTSSSNAAPSFRDNQWKNVWRYYVIVVDRNNLNKVILYSADNNPTTITTTDISAASGSTSTSGLSSVDNNGILYIGRDVAGTSSNYFNGKIDDIMIFNRALSKAEADELYIKTKK